MDVLSKVFPNFLTAFFPIAVSQLIQSTEIKHMLLKSEPLASDKCIFDVQFNVTYFNITSWLSEVDIDIISAAA